MRRRVRLLILLDGAEAAGLVPIKIMRLHALAFFSNILAPVWNMRALDAKVLKRRGGPYYPALQHDLDRMVGIGLVRATHLSFVRGESKTWRLQGSFQLNRELAQPALAFLEGWDEQAALRLFVRELCYALGSLSDTEFDRAMTEDATYGDPDVDDGNVIDFGEWRVQNQSLNAARLLAVAVRDSQPASRGEQLHLYARHLRVRLAARG
jgi:hypothetical protein